MLRKSKMVQALALAVVVVLGSSGVAGAAVGSRPMTERGCC